MADTMVETSTKPYLIRALYEWCCDNGYTPYLAVAVDGRTRVPRQHVKNGEIVMNVSPLATNRLEMGNEFIAFQARFGGVAQEISVPVENVSAIYARETGHGMAFEVSRTATTHDLDESDEAADGRADSDAAPGESAGQPADSLEGRRAGTASSGSAEHGAAGSGGEVIAFRGANAGRGGRSGRRGAALSSVPDSPKPVDGDRGDGGEAPRASAEAGPAAGAAATDVPATQSQVSDGAARTEPAATNPEPASVGTVTEQGPSAAMQDAPDGRSPIGAPSEASDPAPKADATPTAAGEPPSGDDGGAGGQSSPSPRRSRLTRVK